MARSDRSSRYGWLCGDMRSTRTIIYARSSYMRILYQSLPSPLRLHCFAPFFSSSRTFHFSRYYYLLLFRDPIAVAAVPRPRHDVTADDENAIVNSFITVLHDRPAAACTACGPLRCGVEKKKHTHTPYAYPAVAMYGGKKRLTRSSSWKKKIRKKIYER